MLTSSWLVLCVGVCTHLVFLASVFDIYFTSPLVHGMQPQRPLQPPPATRLVLISADGLRADKFYSLTADGEPLAPFLTSIGRDSGVWGVSHTRVPTESRPGHVAMVAGVYEDPSAVTRGWKENPVHFDTIFNQSSHTWSWGSPDILPMLAKGAVPGRVDMSVYGSDQQDFARARPSELDDWVFERVSRLLADEAAAEADRRQINSTLRQSGVVFFLHLLGLDTAGHGYKPHSSQYLDNIRFVDDGVKKIVRQFDTFFGDNRTVYVFTSDHGMTDWGSHGAGDPSETETPLVVWGAGVRGPLYTDADTANPQKLHVEQADLTPLMSVLIGIHMPINSVGRLPVSVLSTSAAHRTDALFTNARQLLCQYERRRYLRQRATLPLIYWPYGPLSSSTQKQLVGTLIDYIGRQDWHNALFLCTELMDMALSGIQYYYTYDRMMLQFSISICYVSWILLLISHLVKTDPSRALTFMLHTKTTSAALIVAFLGTSLAVFLILAKSLPARYAVYLLLPVLLSSCVVYDTAGLQLAWSLLRSDRRLAFKWLALGLGVESLVLAFFQRWVLSALLVAMTPWPLLVGQGRLRKRLATLWVVTSLLLATYPLSPVVTHQTNYTAVKSAALISCAVLLIVSLSPELRLVFPRASVREPATARVVLLLQLILLLVTAGLVHLVDIAVTNNTAVPPLVHSVAWAVLVLSLLLPCLTSSWVLTRLLHVTLGIIAPSILLSLSREAFFCPLLALHLYVWLRLEHQTDQKQLSCLSFEDPLRRKESIRPAVYDDARRAFFYLFFIVLAFFGIGNLDSINSFDPTSVYAFLTVFNPWIMAALLLAKTLLPFLMVCCFSRAVASVTRMSMERLFLSVLLMLDVMSLHFFFLVTDTGSWQQIGFSISHHVISTGTSLFLLLLHQVARLLTGTAVAPILQLASRQLHQRRAGSTDPDTVTALKSD